MGRDWLEGGVHSLGVGMRWPWGRAHLLYPLAPLTRPDHRPGVGVIKDTAGGEGQPFIFLFCG